MTSAAGGVKVAAPLPFNGINADALLSSANRSAPLSFSEVPAVGSLMTRRLTSFNAIERAGLGGS
jgi:hypothetical protein